MTQSALKTACFSLLLLAFIQQGLQDVPVIHYKTKEVLVGQNTSLPCYIENITTHLSVISTEWSKKDAKSSKLALYSTAHGNHYFVPNVTLKTFKGDNGTPWGSHLELPNINKEDAGTYICSISTFPGGSFQRETELRVKDKIECDMNSTIEVKFGENVTIRCDEVSEVNYTWSKDEAMVSDRAYLQLLFVSGANAGLYTLTADTGNRRQQETFTITVFTQTTDYWTDAFSVSPPYNSSSSGSEVTSHSPVNAFTTEDTPKATPPTPALNSQSVQSQSTSFNTQYSTSHPYIQSEASKGFNHSETVHTTLNYNQTEGFDTVSTAGQLFNQSESTNTDMSYNHSGETTPSVHEASAEYAVITDIGSALNKTELPDDSFSEVLTPSTPNTSPGMTLVNTGASLTPTTVPKDPPDSEGQKHLVLTLSIIGVLLIIIVALLLYRRRVIRKRMDLPPPFKPPPPPVKYAAVRSPQPSFPTDRCNSVTVGTSIEMRHTFI